MVATDSDIVNADAPHCVGCGTTLQTAQTGRVRRWCTDACRKKAGRNSQPKPSPSGLPAGGSPSAERAPAGAVADGRPPQAGLPGGGEAQVREFPDTLSWYYAKFSSTPGQDPISSKRRGRYRLRRLLREVTQIERCRSCGREPIANGITVKVSTGKDGHKQAGFGGLSTCGRVWLCPVCAAKIRLRRGDEIAEGVGRHFANGGAAYFWTCTLPHEQGDALKTTFDVMTKAFAHLTRGRAWDSERKQFGVIGSIKAVEVTHSRNGWHPHTHVIVLTERPLTFDELCSWYARLDARWAAGLVRNGWSAGQAPYRFRMDPVQKSRDGERLAAYVAKVQDKGIGNEMARADMKGGRQGSRTPFEILADFGNGALADDLELWWEYEQATIGRSAIRWSPGLKARLLPDEEELSDDDIAAEDLGGETVAVLAPHLWWRIQNIPEAEIAVLEAVEAAGFDGLLRTLMTYRIEPDGAYTPDQWATPGEVRIDD